MKRYLISLKSYNALAFIGTFCLISVASSLIVISVFWAFGSDFSLSFGILMVCILVMIFGGILFYFISAHFLRYVTNFKDATAKIANGDFSVRVDRKRDKFSGDFLYLHELDELAFSINKMAYELENMNFMQKDFISNVSHELKTPLSIISGYCEILLENPKDSQKFLNLIHAQTHALNELCENMLMLSRLENQNIISKNDKIRLDEQIRKAVSLLMQKYSTHKITLKLAQISLNTNALLLMQVWLNLIDNALKYSKGKIFIYLTSLNDEILIFIKDNGGGIDESKIGRVFDKFYQCEESHKTKGNGLGLSIVKRILELLGGKISLINTKNGLKVIVSLKRTH